MRRLLAIGGRWAGMLLTAALLFGACAGDSEPPDPLAAVLAREKSAALAAARFGTSGGQLQISSGDRKGVLFTVPAGALSSDTVISLYAGPSVGAQSGFRAVGPSVEVRGVGGQLVKDAVIQIPFNADAVTGPLSQVVMLRDAANALGALPGSYVDEDRSIVRAPVRKYGGFAPAVDTNEITIAGGGVASYRCAQETNWGSLRMALSGTQLLARASMSDAEVFHALAPYADGCGLAFNWEVVWYSPSTGRTESYSYAATGASGPIGVGSTGCTPGAVGGTGDSTAMSDDFAVRFGTTPQSLRIELRNCESGTAPRVRLTAGGTAWYGEYGLDANFLGKNF